MVGVSSDCTCKLFPEAKPDGKFKDQGKVSLTIGVMIQLAGRKAEPKLNEIISFSEAVPKLPQGKQLA